MVKAARLQDRRNESAPARLLVHAPLSGAHFQSGVTLMSLTMISARKLVLISLVALAVPALGACTTVKGAGKDIEKGGEAIQDGAEEVHDDITN
jgi:entericidin B